MLTQDLIDAAGAGTLHGLFRERVRRTPDAVAYRHYDRAAGCWRQLSWSEMAARVGRWQEAMAREGLQPGDRVALGLRNGIEWVAFDQAALGLGLVTVPLYLDDRPENSAHIVRDSGALLVVIQDPIRWHRVASALDHLPSLRRVVLAEGEADAGVPLLRSLADWLPDGDFPLREAPTTGQAPEGGDKLATIIYTSGTTGRPKGVMLSHRNILSVAEAGLRVVRIYREDCFLSFLPMPHTFERTVGYYLPMMAGSTVAFARSINQLAEDLLTVRPTVLIAVPRVFERFYGRLEQQLEKASAARQALLRHAARIGWRRFEYRQGRSPWSESFLLWPLLYLLVGRKVLARLGGRLRLVVSGGAALPPEIARLFIGLGLPILQGYGLTETSPQVSVNLPEDNDPASVGRPLPGMEVAIGEGDELLVRTPGMMLGYWNNPEATAAMIREGWLHTGDQVRIEEGRIYITGRLKDVLVLSNGEKVPPADMEMAIALDPLIEQAMIVGEGRSYLSALLVLDPEKWNEIAAAQGLDPADEASLADRKLHHDILQRVARQLKDFPGWAKVRRVHLLLEPWTIENGLLTPTMKIKRAKVTERYAEAIMAMYRPHHPRGEGEHGAHGDRSGE